MTLRKWRSNDPLLLTTIPEELRELADLHLPSPLSAFKALGIHWDVDKDNFYISVPSVNDNLSETKGVIASVSAKVFDILGFFSPATVPSQILLQELWKLKLSCQCQIVYLRNGNNVFQHYQLYLLIRFLEGLLHQRYHSKVRHNMVFLMLLQLPTELWFTSDLYTKIIP